MTYDDIGGFVFPFRHDRHRERRRIGPTHGGGGVFEKVQGDKRHFEGLHLHRRIPVGKDVHREAA